MRTALLRASLLAAAPLTTAPLAAQTVVRGTVRGPGGPVAGASVFLAETLEGAQTDSAGAFTFRAAVPPAGATLVVDAAGYRQIRRRWTADAGPAVFVLARGAGGAEAATLPEFVVQAGRYTASAERGATLTPLEVVTTPGAAAARAELHALRAQLDPHFLFNTLHSLTALARRDPAAVERGLERFGGLLRYVLDANRRESMAGQSGDVPLEDELRFVRDYLTLERMRLGERLRAVEDVDEEALECGLPALTLQPLVENAVRHGLAPRAAGGTVRVAARVDDAGRLVVEVGDDGAGCDAAAVDAAARVGVGVVRRRLQARYGAEGRLDVVTAPGQGFTARVTVPARSAGARATATVWPARARAPEADAPEVAAADADNPVAARSP